MRLHKVTPSRAPIEVPGVGEVFCSEETAPVALDRNQRGSSVPTWQLAKKEARTSEVAGRGIGGRQRDGQSRTVPGCSFDFVNVRNRAFETSEHVGLQETAGKTKK